jgi:hypothetical protein
VKIVIDDFDLFWESASRIIDVDYCKKEESGTVEGGTFYSIKRFFSLFGSVGQSTNERVSRSKRVPMRILDSDGNVTEILAKSFAKDSELSFVNFHSLN